MGVERAGILDGLKVKNRRIIPGKFTRMSLAFDVHVTHA